MSFESLESKNDKELFLHIACFFVGIDRDITETILKACKINTRTGITHLIDMGRNEVRQESPDKPWKREESFKVLKQKKGTGKTKGLTLDMKVLEKEKLWGSFELKIDALSNMDNLSILITSNKYIFN